jgi:glycerophosphoryl diester phosphodiesterase
LREAISWLVENDMRVNLEIKPFNDNILSITTGVLKNLDLFWPQDMSLPIISSFNYEVLQLLKEYKPNLPLGLLLEFWPPNWLDLAQKINCKNINISKQIITKNIVSEIKLHGLAVNVFTVNTPKLAYTLCDWGVAGIFSDYPDLLSSGFGNKHK